ncbi:hypothetical protein HZ326_22757 [Fusarium oxysporum f. sp. albedinis]|nr:hypothetical protein HZ326_22757 [Fusarium oxysporum f. sp. albedinis]
MWILCKELWEANLRIILLLSEEWQIHGWFCRLAHRQTSSNFPLPETRSWPGPQIGKSLDLTYTQHENAALFSTRIPLELGSDIILTIAPIAKRGRPRYGPQSPCS